MKTVRMRDDVYDIIKASAKNSCRSMTNELYFILMDYKNIKQEIANSNMTAEQKNRKSKEEERQAEMDFINDPRNYRSFTGRDKIMIDNDLQDKIIEATLDNMEAAHGRDWMPLVINDMTQFIPDDLMDDWRRLCKEDNGFEKETFHFIQFKVQHGR